MIKPVIKPFAIGLFCLALSACSASSSPATHSQPAAKTCIQTTTNALDWAIDGTGYFNVLDPATGKRLFTRKGSFKLTDKGEIATSEGYLLDPAVTIVPGTTNYRIERDGTVMVAQPGQTDATAAARVTISRFANSEQLQAETAGYYTPTAASGSAENGQPGVNGFGAIQAKALESSTCN